MAENKYRWNITDINVRVHNNDGTELPNDLEDVVEAIHWEFFAESDVPNPDDNNGGNYMARLYGSVPLKEADPDNFIKFEEISQEKMIEWTKENLGDKSENEMKGAADRVLKNLIKPPVVQKLPASWNKKD